MTREGFQFQHYSLVTNDADATRRVVDSFRSDFPEERIQEGQPGEDFGLFGSEWHVPSVFWFVGGTDPETFENAKVAGRIGEIPTNRNPRFAPVIHPTPEAGFEALVSAAGAWLTIH
jgi:metal-dependent amidase/aminoacylase/carboxypeptidase family protein